MHYETEEAAKQARCYLVYCTIFMKPKYLPTCFLFVCILEYPGDSFRSIGGSECFLPFARTMPITCPVFRRALQAIEKVDGMMIGEKTVQAGDAFLQHLEMTIQMISKKYRRI